MEPAKTKFKTVAEYLDAAPDAVRNQLKALHKLIKEAAPQAEEVISYNMPAFKQHGILVYYAANKNHIGFYPTPNPIKIFKDRLANYKTSKSAIQFPLAEPVPEDLIKDIVRFRIKENEEKTMIKKKK